jgi:hypothetical protein
MRHETFVLETLGSDERSALFDRFFHIHNQIFSGTTKDRIRASVFESTARETRLRIFLNDEGIDIGFCVLYRFHLDIDGHNLVVFRTDAGVLPQYRRRLITLSFGLFYVLGFKLKHPFKNMVYFESIVHPSSYHLFYKYFYRMYPSPERRMPDNLRIIRRRLFDKFKMRPAVSGSEEAMNSGWVTRSHECEHEYWQQLHRVDVDYFFRQNPGYQEGDGLLIILPITFHNLIYCMGRLLARKLGS